MEDFQLPIALLLNVMRVNMCNISTPNGKEKAALLGGRPGSWGRPQSCLLWLPGWQQGGCSLDLVAVTLSARGGLLLFPPAAKHHTRPEGMAVVGTWRPWSLSLRDERPEGAASVHAVSLARCQHSPAAHRAGLKVVPGRFWK